MTDKDKLKDLDPNDPFTKARLDWAQTSEEKKKEFCDTNAAAIDRWQSETDALQEDEEAEDE